MAEQLTLQQQRAVYDRGGRLLVSAAAGSGKTKVLVDRLLSYLTDENDPANIDDFLMITYTKAAAAELRGKIAAKLTERVALEPENIHLHNQLQRLYLTKISTVHAFCGEVLREYAYQLNLPGDFRVADENECNEIREQVMEKILTASYEENQQDVDFRAFVDSQGLGRDDRLVPKIVMQGYDSARCHLNPGLWLDHCREQVNTHSIGDAAQTPYGAFLMERLKSWLELQIDAIENCVALAAVEDGFERPVALLQDHVFQLKQLYDAQTWEQVNQRRNIDFGRLTFPKNASNTELIEGIKTVREACKTGLKKRTQPFVDSSEQVMKDLASSSDAVSGLIRLVEAFGRAYDEAKQSRRIMDFGDLEHKMLDLLLGKTRTGTTAAAREIGGHFREVMVDEYQDSNAVQDAIYGALTQERKNLFMVGDVKQSIYQFRLADPGIFLEKYNRFVSAEEAKPGEDRKVILSRNFRSSGGVLDGCNDVFRLCMSPQVGGMYYRAEEALYEGLPHVSLGEPEVELHCIDVQQETYPEEAEYVADQIQKMLRYGQVRDGDALRSVRPEDIVILLRSPGSAGGYFQRALEKRGIRYATGGGVDLLKTEEVGTIYAILQTIYNPRLDIPLVAALLSPAFGFTADDLAAIRSKHKSCAFYDALRQDEGEKSRHFIEMLLHLRSVASHFSLTELLEQLLILTSLEEIYAAMESGQTRLTNIQTFYQLAVDFEAAGNRDLGRFLEHLSSMEQKGLISAGEQTGAGCVTIMSIHKSKGLEFPVVYLCGLGRDFNMESQREAVLCHKQMGLGMSAVDSENRLRYPTVAKRAISAKIGEESVSEELRVLYVAMTRARDRLIMTYATQRLEKELTQLVQRLNMGCLQLLTREATCPGQWVLLTALHKTEAGELFALGGKPMQTTTGRKPWKIKVATVMQPVVACKELAESNVDISQETLDQIRQGLNFSYAYEAAVKTPSKLTATGLKGRYQDEEAAEQTPSAGNSRFWRRPSFLEMQVSGKAYGNAVHKLMQYIDFSACGTCEEVDDQIQQLCNRGYLTAQEGASIDRDSIAAFFATELGKKLSRVQTVREFKFSILEDGGCFNQAVAGEQILLQGVVDCAMLEEDGITIIDFKTDHVTEQTLEQKVAGYASQVRAYARAMERIFEKPTKQRLLYFFHMGRLVSV